MPILTHEVVNGKRVQITAKFRAYPTLADSVLDRASFFLQNPRYRKCFLETTGEGWAQAFAAADYATDPSYADKLVAIMRGRDLAHFDKLPAEVKP